MRLQEVAQEARIGVRRLGLCEIDVRVHTSVGSFTSNSGLNRDDRRRRHGSELRWRGNEIEVGVAREGRWR